MRKMASRIVLAAVAMVLLAGAPVLGGATITRAVQFAAAGPFGTTPMKGGFSGVVQMGDDDGLSTGLATQLGRSPIPGRFRVEGSVVGGVQGNFDRWPTATSTLVSNSWREAPRGHTLSASYSRQVNGPNVKPCPSVWTNRSDGRAPSGRMLMSASSNMTAVAALSLYVSTSSMLKR